MVCFLLFPSNNVPGNGCVRRKINIINDAFGNQGLFEDVLRNFRNGFKVLAQSLEKNIEVAVSDHLLRNGMTFIMIRRENAALESEADPKFTERVSNSVTAAKAELDQLNRVVLQGQFVDT